MLDLAIARMLHVLAVVHWIGGVAMATLVVLPGVARLTDPAERMARFEAVESRFAPQARVSIIIVGLTGFYMTWRMDAWYRFAEPGYWWMHAMVCVWLLFVLLLFVGEPLFLHRWFHKRAEADSDRAFAFAIRAHRILLAAALVTIAGAVLGAHGVLLFG
ncbi:hypothetical protein [Sphingomonas flavalba]|uniref:hypothetical protein n=1 Tax=Sphingomonas flavalba TaxID=2559804 RepID=UPI00109E1901|nr:hypothetical protein [Sphingomonas flavalba]